ncbi:MauE/DoxX family redox-associated membrane protein [Desulfobacterales bacterium HSG2]|nr:MauE/DoxX family redox-associated membrane protein [Desulfobacterales bacterium HSG2]
MKLSLSYLNNSGRMFFSDKNSVWPYRLIRILLSLIFIWSGITKLADPASFAVIIGDYGLLPENLLLPAALGLSVFEVIAGLCLLLDIRGSLTIVTGLLILFMAILSYGIWMGFDIDCGCFGPDDPEADAYHGLRSALYRDMVMMTGIIYLYMWRYIRSFRSETKVSLKTY